VEAFLAGHLSATALTYGSDLRDLTVFAATRGLAALQLGRQDLDLYVRHLLEERGLAVSTVRRRLAAVTSFFGWAVQEGWVDGDPTRWVRRPREHRPPAQLRLSRHEAALLLDGARQHSARAHLLLRLMLVHGCRVSEVLAATVEDLSGPPARRELRIVGKGRAVRVLVLSPSTVQVVNDLLGGRRSGPLLPSATGGHWHRTNAARLLRRLGREVLDEEVANRLHPHALRRSFVDLALADGATLTELQHALGHKTPGMVLRYAACEPFHRDPLAWRVDDQLDAERELIAAGKAGRGADRVSAGSVYDTPGDIPAMLAYASSLSMRDCPKEHQESHPFQLRDRATEAPHSTALNGRCTSTDRLAERACDQPVDGPGEVVRLSQLVVPGAGQRHDEGELGGEQLLVVVPDQVGVLAQRVDAPGAQAAVALLGQPAVLRDRLADRVDVGGGLAGPETDGSQDICSATKAAPVAPFSVVNNGWVSPC
jgi:site-specific recombinase XerD